MSNQLAKVVDNSISVAMSVHKGMVVHAKGDPATVVSVATAAAIVAFGAGLGAGAYYGAKALFSDSR